MVVLNNVRKAYGQIVAVDDLSLTIPQGQTIGLLGPNGAGKTTTVRLIVGSISPDQGTIEIDGQPSGSANARRCVGMAPQSIALYDDLTAEENLQFYCRLYGLNRKTIAARTAWALEFSQLIDRARDRTKTFSGGMKRRLNLAVALVHDPPVIFLDEPTVGVDPQSRNHIFEAIQQLQQSGRTIIYTSHYMEEVQQLCDRVAIMDHGKVLADGTPTELIERHGAMPHVVARLRHQGSSPLPGTVSESTWTFDSPTPLEEISRAMESGTVIESLELKEASLESVFLNLTGRTLRD